MTKKFYRTSNPHLSKPNEYINNNVECMVPMYINTHIHTYDMLILSFLSGVKEKLVIREKY